MVDCSSSQVEVPLSSRNLVGSSEDLSCIEEGVEQFVLFEETSANVYVERLSDVIQKDFKSLFQLVTLSRLVQSAVEETREEVERVLVHGIDQGEVGNHEVKN